jgi:hypothetical protein
MTDAHHYEEMQAYFNLYAEAGVGIAFWDQYRFDITWTVDVLQFSPYRQTFWFSRFLANMATGSSDPFELWAGGAYELSFGSAYISYCESAYTYSGELFTYLASNGGSSWITGSPAHADHQCWDDSTYSVSVADYMPQNMQDMVGT